MGNHWLQCLLAALVALPVRVSGTVKMSCSQLVLDRIDPLVDPGMVGSPHLHQIVGGNSFNATMDPATDPAELSTCTSCTFLDDFSNYWTAAMYYQARNGTFKRIKQLGSLFHEEANGGITIYYFDTPGLFKTTTFKKGFRMRTGNPAVRDEEGAAKYQEIKYICLKEVETRFTNISTDFPQAFCKYGIMTEISFPSCWDGVNLDSPDHFSHVAYPIGGSYEEGGTFQKGAPCPASHPVQLPQLLLEIRWDTSPYNTPELWREDGSQPFLWSFGDRRGYGSHGDYLFGWKGDSLQRFFDAKCKPLLNCIDLPTQEIPEANKCTKQPMVDEDIEGWLDELPGGMQVLG